MENFLNSLIRYFVYDKKTKNPRGFFRDWFSGSFTLVIILYAIFMLASSISPPVYVSLLVGFFGEHIGQFIQNILRTIFQLPETVEEYNELVELF